MEAQSPLVSSTERSEAEGKTWDMDDVLDLTGGAGAFSHRQFPEVAEEEEEEEEDRATWKDSLEASPEEETQPGPVVPSAPMEEKPSGSVDGSLFPLPVASAPLMHSSERIMDFQQPPSTVSTAHVEHSSLLLESTSSLPILPSLSADSFREHASTIAFPTDLAEIEPFQVQSDRYKISMTMADMPLSDPLGSDDFSYSTVIKDQVKTSGEGQVKQEVIFSEKGYIVEHPTSPEDTVYEENAKLYSQSAKEMFSGMLKSVVPPNEEISDIKEAQDDQYVDFKPFVSMGDITYGAKDIGLKLESDVDRLNLGLVAKHDDQDIDLSDDISPLTPEVTPDSTDYEMFANLEKGNPFSYGGSHNKTDEIKIKDIETQKPSVIFGSNVATVNPFFDHSDKEQAYVTTQSISGAMEFDMSSRPEGRTPDIVQEAYESETYDIGIPKLSYESKIDLVQTAANSGQENISPTAPGLLEETDSISSPVLPDIVMEAPLASSGLETFLLKPDVSPVGGIPTANEKKLKTESEKPPTYEEAVNKVVAHSWDHSASYAEPKQGIEEPEAPYISIACDLVKETITTEPVVCDFTDFSKYKQTDFDSQFIENLDDSSPESEPSEPSYKQWHSDVVKKETFNIFTENVKSEFSEKEHGNGKKSGEVSPIKVYLESSQPELHVSKDSFDILAKKRETGWPEKTLQMEEFDKGLYSETTPSSKHLPFLESADLSRPSPVQPTEESGFKKTDDIQKAVHEAKEPREPIPQIKSNLEKKENIELVKDLLPGSEKPKEFGKPTAVTLGDEDITPPREKLVEKSYSPSKEDNVSILPIKECKDPSTTTTTTTTRASSTFRNSVVDLIYWRDIKKSGAVFGASLFLLLSLSVFSIVSVFAYVALALLSVTISFRIYKGILQAIQKSDEGHPFRSVLESSFTVSEDAVQKYCNSALNHINCTIKELRRLFLVEDLVDSLKFAVLMWVFTYIGALFNGLTLLILALISLFSIPVIYERHQTQVDHYVALINKNIKSTSEMILSKIPGLKRKNE
ncbi:hypothetical protein GDO86_009017 [Hymenochirus boettgeri]|uniref:Reticulon n=1 Tax=Hymenochirus boettgeri TaxID=247094 RepID=A0A8T2JED9_9PIPI|nr:hypothetical protein GDO86_009017 [Hymenochirus boettgeri]